MTTGVSTRSSTWVRRHPALLALAWMAAFALPAHAAIETDPQRIKEFVAGFLKERRPPASYHIVRQIDTVDRGAPGRRVDEFIGTGEYRYWKLEETSPRAPQRTKETLVAPDAQGRLMVWEESQVPRPIEPGRAYLADPLGFLSYPPSTARELRLATEGGRAVLEYIEDTGRTRRVVLDLARGSVEEETSAGPGAGETRRLKIERFDTVPKIDPAFFEGVRQRLEGRGRETQQRTVATGVLALLATVVGAIAPIAYALMLYRRRLRPPFGRKMLVAVLAFVIAIPAGVYGLLVLTRGFLTMILTAFTWPLVQDWLPRDFALAVAQGLNALVLSAALSALVWLMLWVAVLRRQG